MNDFMIPHNPAREVNQRKFRFCHPHGYKGDRLIVSFYETYIKDDDVCYLHEIPETCLKEKCDGCGFYRRD